MSRGRKKATTNGLDWEGLFTKSQGVYFQFILSELGKKTDFSITNDTGAELLEKIKAEKAQLIKVKKLKAEKDFPAIKPNEIPFEIPKNWFWCRLSEICTKIGSGSTPKGSNYSQEGLPFFRSQNIYNQGLVYDDISFISNEVHQQMNGTIVYPNDILLNITGGSMGRCAIVPNEFEEGNVSQHVCIIRPLNCDNKYLHKIILSPFFQELIFSSTTGSGREGLPKYNLEQFVIPLPPLSEQQLIIDFLQDFGNQSLIENKEYFDSETEEKALELHESQLMGNQLSTELTHQLDLVKQLRQSFLREAMQGKLLASPPSQGRGMGGGVETGQQLLEKIKAEKAQLIAAKKLKKEKDLPPIKPEDIPFEIPEHWTWCRLGEVCTKITDGFHHTPKKQETGKVYISATHIKDNGINWKECLYIPEKDHNELYKKAFPIKGEILITNRGAGCATPAIIDIDEEFSFQNAALIGYNQNLVYNKFIYYFILKSRDEIMETFVNGGLQPMLSNVVLSTIPIPLPPLSEQRRIVEKLESLMQTCDALEASIKSSQVQNQQLLQQVLREALRK